MRCAAGVIMSDLHDRITRLAAEAQQRADVAGTQATWQEGRARGLREAATIIAADAGTQVLRDGIRDDIRDYIESLRGLITTVRGLIREADAAGADTNYRQGCLRILLRVSEELRGLIAADEPEEGGDE